MTIAAIGSAIWRFAKGLPAWVWYVLLIIAAGYFIDMRARGQQRQKDKDDNQREALKEQARVDQTRREISQENSNARDAVDAAVDALPKYSVRERLRRDDPDTAAVVLGPDPRHGS